MAMQFGTTPDASLLRLARRVSPVTGAALRCGIGGHVFALGGDVRSDGIAGMDDSEGGRVPAAEGAK